MLGLQSIASLSITPWVPYGIGAIAAFWALIFGVWVWIRRREIPKVLLPDLDELADLLEQELSTGKLPSYQLVGKLTEVGAHLNAYRIDCPNFHGLDNLPMGVWSIFVRRLRSELKRRNIRRARTVIDCIDMPQELRPPNALRYWKRKAPPGGDERSNEE